MDELPNRPEHDFYDEPNTAWMSPTLSSTPSSEGEMRGDTMCNLLVQHEQTQQKRTITYKIW